MILPQIKCNATRHHVDQLNADKRDHDAPSSVDQKVSSQQRTGADGTIGDAFQGQRNQPDDDQCVEDDRRQDGTLRGRQTP